MGVIYIIPKRMADKDDLRERLEIVRKWLDECADLTGTDMEFTNAAERAEAIVAEALAHPERLMGEPVGSGNPLLWNVHCMFQQEDRGEDWQIQMRDLLAAIEQHLQRVKYPNAAKPVGEVKP